MSKIVVGVLRGGPSSEYEVSLDSGKTVLTNLPEKYRPVDVFISKNGEWHTDGLVRTPAKALDGVDVVFNSLHGEFGEDGQVQRILEGIQIPYTGSDSISSALGMHKARAKEAFARLGLKVPNHRIVLDEEDPALISREIFETMFLPLIVKPISTGSSVGMTFISNYRDLEDALKSAFKYGKGAMVEQYIKGRETTCGVLEKYRDNEHYALLPVEIICPSEKKYFDYDEKYSEKSQTQKHCPGNFTHDEKRAIENAAVRAHQSLGLRHYSRSDFIMTPKGEIYVLEANSQPGLTEHSFLPLSLRTAGTEMPEFLDHVIELALKK